jgi:hypothetical protein
MFITPHLGGATIDALKETERIVMEQFINIRMIK